MKNTLLRSLLLGACSVASFSAVAGGVDVNPCCQPPRVDIPEMREGWGFNVEGSALRSYNNNLNYSILPIITSEVSGDNTFTSENLIFKGVDPVYAFGLRVGVDYTLADSANVLKLSYEHLFSREAKNNSAVNGTYINPDYVDIVSEGSVRDKLDGVSLVSEQHILIGPYWEATLTGGARFAHISQELKASTASIITNASGTPIAPLAAEYEQNSMQFNGVGPLAGIGGIFHVANNFSLGAEAQGALLMGRNKINFQIYESVTTEPAFAPDLTTTDIVANSNVNRIYSIVPEMYYRIYGNYFHRFNDGSQLEIEAGWRANQFFNLRTFANLYSAEEIVGFGSNTSTSDDIGFSGPYLLLHYKL